MQVAFDQHVTEYDPSEFSEVQWLIIAAIFSPLSKSLPFLNLKEHQDRAYRACLALCQALHRRFPSEASPKPKRPRFSEEQVVDDDLFALQKVNSTAVDPLATEL